MDRNKPIRTDSGCMPDENVELHTPVCPQEEKLQAERENKGTKEKNIGKRFKNSQLNCMFRNKDVSLLGKNNKQHTDL